MLLEHQFIRYST